MTTRRTAMRPNGAASHSRCELLFNQPIQMRSDHGLIEALDDFGEESGDDEALGDFDWDAAGAEIEEFVFVDLAAGGAVSATDVVGQNFEAGHGVGLGIVAQEKVSHFLIGIGEMRMRFDTDESAET